MGLIKFMGGYAFPKGAVRVLWDLGEEQHGLEIDIDFDYDSGDLEGLGNWSFGYDRDTWLEWGNWIENRIVECNGNLERLQELLEFLDSIDCIYHPEEGEHLQDIKIIKRLISRNTEELIRFQCYDSQCNHIFLSLTNLWEEYLIQCPKCGCAEEGFNNRQTHFQML